MRQLEDLLGRQPLWDPPPGFVRRAVVLASTASQQWPALERGRGGRLVRAAAVGLTAAAVAYLIGSLLLAVAPTVIQDTTGATDSYATFVELTMRLMAARAVHVAWLSAALSLSFATTLVLRARL
ncbi:MAG: hypothetical protein ACRD3C_07350 [Vicinamibacterales bacterium]